MSGQTAAKSRAKTIEKLTNRQIAGLTQTDYINMNQDYKCRYQWYETPVIEDAWPLLREIREELRTTGSIFNNPKLQQRFANLTLPSYPMKQCSEERVVYLELVNEPKEAREKHITFWLDVKMLPKEWKPTNFEEVQRIFADPIKLTCYQVDWLTVWDGTPYETLAHEDYAKFADWEDGMLDNSLAIQQMHYNAYPPEDALRAHDNREEARDIQRKKEEMQNMEIGFCKLINDLSYAGSEAPSRIIVCIPRSGRPLVKEWGPKMAPHATFFVHSQPEEICFRGYDRLGGYGREGWRIEKWTNPLAYVLRALDKIHVRTAHKREEPIAAAPYPREPVTLPIDETWIREGNTVTCAVSYQGNELYSCPCPTNVSFEQNRAQVFPLGDVNERLQRLLDEAGAVRVTGGTISTNIRFDTLDPVFSKSLLSYFADSKSFQTEEDRSLERREALSNFADGFLLY